MKKTLLLILSIVALSANAQYYVAPDGNDNWPGTIDEPWGTLQAALERAEPGDIVYFRDGTWYPEKHYGFTSDAFHYDPSKGIGNTGEPGKPIIYTNYPDEKPIIDFSLVVPSGVYNVGFYLTNVHHVTISGLTFQNLAQTDSDGPNVQVIDARKCSYLTFERLTIQNSGGPAIRYFSGLGDDLGIFTDTTKVINCDFFNNADRGGNHADGLKFDQDKGAYFLFEGNRAFFNSDDGFDISGSAMRIFKNNWAWGTGWVPGGNGNGFKTGALRDSLDYPSVILINNISAYSHSPETNSGAGFDIVDYQVSDTSYRRANARFYNNIAFRNDLGFFETNNPLWKFRNCIYRNNISYGSVFELDGYPINVSIIGYQYNESHNTWDWEKGGYSFVETDTVTMNDNTWLTVDSATIINEMMAPRKSDGSLPDLPTAFQLAPGSDLIDAGTQIPKSDGVYYGLPFNGIAPDLGAFESDTEPGTSNKYPSVTITTPKNGSAFSDPTLEVEASDPDGSISRVEYFWNKDNSIGEANSAPWSYVWNNSVFGSLFLWARATDNEGATSTSERVYAKKMWPLNYFQNKHENLHIFPNPSEGVFEFVLPKPLNSVSNIRIASIEGKILYQSVLMPDEDRKEFDLSDFRKGLYILMVSNNEGFHSHKFVLK